MDVALTDPGRIDSTVGAGAGAIAFAIVVPVVAPCRIPAADGSARGAFAIGGDATGEAGTAWRGAASMAIADATERTATAAMAARSRRGRLRIIPESYVRSGDRSTAR